MRYKRTDWLQTGDERLMEIDRDALQKKVHELYAREHAELGERGTLEHLERGGQWKLADTLSAGGVLVFPHAGVHDCGYQMAACAQAALDSGADKVVVISVLHAFTPAMEQARVAVAAGEDPADFEFWEFKGRVSTVATNGEATTP